MYNRRLDNEEKEILMMQEENIAMEKEVQSHEGKVIVAWRVGWEEGRKTKEIRFPWNGISPLHIEKSEMAKK